MELCHVGRKYSYIPSCSAVSRKCTIVQCYCWEAMHFRAVLLLWGDLFKSCTTVGRQLPVLLWGSHAFQSCATVERQ